MTELESLINVLIKRIVKKNGIKDPFELEITKGMNDEYTIAIQKGNPPKLFVNYYAIVYSVQENNKLKFLSDRLERAIEKIPKMTWTLSNDPPADSIALGGKSVTRWIKANSFESFVRVISDKLFKIQFSVDVSVEDTLTGYSIKLHGDNPFKLVEEAKKRLAQMILESEKKEEALEYLEITSQKKVEDKPDMIVISEGVREIREDYKYE